MQGLLLVSRSRSAWPTLIDDGHGEGMRPNRVVAIADRMDQRPVAATISAVSRDEEILLVRRANPPDQVLWGFPGGKIDHGETIEAAAVRELKEETGIEASAVEVFTAVDVIVPGDDVRPQFHYVLIAVLCRWLNGEPVVGDDALEARWFDFEGLNRGDLAMSLDVAKVADQARMLAMRRDL